MEFLGHSVAWGQLGTHSADKCLVNNGCAAHLFMSVSPEEAAGKEDLTGIIQFHATRASKGADYLNCSPAMCHPLCRMSCEGLSTLMIPNCSPTTRPCKLSSAQGIHHMQTNHHRGAGRGVTRLYQACTLLPYPLKLPPTQ